uniref:Uncharacterized protein n=1 Tax=Cacopsylla melanoneura TaxID=428564 RepID=A0A8D8S6Q3_9HEMI
MAFLTKSVLAGLLLISIACFARAVSDSAEIPLEKTMGSTLRDKHIYLCSCNSIQEVVGYLPCDELWKNHAQEKFEENLQLLIKYGMPDNWDSVEKLSRVESQCTLFEAVAVPLFDCYTAQITNANGTLPVEELRVNWLYNKAAENDKILEKYGALVEGNNQQKGALETAFIRCLRTTIAEVFSSNRK